MLAKGSSENYLCMTGCRDSNPREYDCPRGCASEIKYIVCAKESDIVSPWESHQKNDRQDGW